MMIKEVPNYPGYFVDKLGNVYSERRGKRRKLKPHLNSYGYLWISVTRGDGSFRKEGIHRLVLFAFIGLPSEAQETRHLNGIRTDNRLFNLAWGTRKQQQADAIRHGSRNRNRHKIPKQKSFIHFNAGEANGNTKLAVEDVCEMRRLYLEGLTQKEIAKRFNVWDMTVSRIVRRKRWTHI
jgi:predicted DNA-binding protein (UPF0251 family)